MEILVELLLSFLQIGLFSIGGGYAVIPLIQEQVVVQRHWVDMQTFTDIITISQMTPGPLAVNTSTFVGIQIAGIPGAILATLGCVLSGILLSLTLFCFFKRHSGSGFILKLLDALKASSLGLIVAAAATILLLTFTGESFFSVNAHMDWIAAGIFAFCLFLLHKKRLGPIPLMAMAGIVGLILY